MKPSNSLLGILGGLGPMSSAYFYELITEHTYATCDQDHIDIIISSRATTPDRTAFITGQSYDDPLPIMVDEVQRLTGAGATIIAMPCNTAHYFYYSLCDVCSVPILNIISLTVQYAAHIGARSIGIMATEGTIRTEAYKKICDAYNIKCVIPSCESQKLLSSIIYDSIKHGETVPDTNGFKRVSDELVYAGCDSLILGCTELSLIKRVYPINEIYIDSLDVLAACAIASCGKKLRKYPATLMDFAQKHCLSERNVNNDSQ